MSKALDTCKPLIGGSKDGRLFRPPIVRVLMIVVFYLQKCAVGRQGVDDCLVSVSQDTQPEKLFASFNGELADIIDRTQKLQPIL